MLRVDRLKQEQKHAMPFTSTLEQLLSEVFGASGAIVVDWEGEAVNQAGNLSADTLKLFGAHAGIMFNQLSRVVRNVSGNTPQEVVVRMAEGTFVVFPLAEGYLLVVYLEPVPLVPAILQLMRGFATRLRHELLCS